MYSSGSLDSIPGVGPTRRKALMRHFDSIADIKEASVEELCQVPEIPQHIAEGIYNFFHDGQDEVFVLE